MTTATATQTINWPGLSGREYRYYIYPIGTPFNAAPGATSSPRKPRQDDIVPSTSGRRGTSPSGSTTTTRCPASGSRRQPTFTCTATTAASRHAGWRSVTSWTSGTRRATDDGTRRRCRWPAPPRSTRHDHPIREQATPATALIAAIPRSAPRPRCRTTARPGSGRWPPMRSCQKAPARSLEGCGRGGLHEGCRLCRRAGSCPPGDGFAADEMVSLLDHAAVSSHECQRRSERAGFRPFRKCPLLLFVFFGNSLKTRLLHGLLTPGPALIAAAWFNFNPAVLRLLHAVDST